jgi:hypothetical protein
MTVTDRRLTPGTHVCPGGCGRTDIPNRLYACPGCWSRLPRHLQRGITRTVRSGWSERSEALKAAAEFYASTARPEGESR